MGEQIKAGDAELWVERRGHGPDVLLIAGLGDPAEAWQPQLEGLADRYHQPFQEVPDDFNARLDAFWREAAGRG